MKKNNLKKSIIILISYFICFVITRLHLKFGDINQVISLNIVQFSYFLAVLIINFLIFFYHKSEKILLISSTIGLILYSACFYCFTKSLLSLFIHTAGIINLVTYFSKIYFITLPLLGFYLYKIIKENTKKLCFLSFIKILLLLIITIVFKHFLGTPGVLYAWTLDEFIFLFLLIIFNKYKYQKSVE